MQNTCLVLACAINDFNHNLVTARMTGSGRSYNDINVVPLLWESDSQLVKKAKLMPKNSTQMRTPCKGTVSQA
jgi:hypothetical protein